MKAIVVYMKTSLKNIFITTNNVYCTVVDKYRIDNISLYHNCGRYEARNHVSLAPLMYIYGTTV
jgi:hypothetical protein